MNETPNSSHDPLNAITPDFAAAVGYVAMYWSALEIQVFNVLGHAIGGDSTVNSILVAETSFLQKLDVLNALIHYSRRGDLLEEWQTIENKINHLRAKRNDVIHGLWGADEDLNHYVTRIKARRSLTIMTGPATIQQIAALYNEIGNCFNEFTTFGEKLIAENFAAILKAPTGQPLNLVQSQKSRAQDQARVQKQARKLADRALSEARKLAKKKDAP